METFFRVTGPLRAGNSPVTGEFSAQKASEAELWCHIWSAPKQTVESTLGTPMIPDAITLIIASL